MAGKTLGKLEQVDVRDHWPDEAKHFTPWLASELPDEGEETSEDL